MGLDENGYNREFTFYGPIICNLHCRSANDVLKSPRGIRGFQLDNGGHFDVWKVQGKVGGYKKYVMSRSDTIC